MALFFSDLLTIFWTFLDNYPVKSDIIGLIDSAGCWKFNFSICSASFLREKLL